MPSNLLLNAPCCAPNLDNYWTCLLVVIEHANFYNSFCAQCMQEKEINMNKGCTTSKLPGPPVGNSGYQKLKHIRIRQCCGQEVAPNLVSFYTLEGTYIYM